MSKYVKLIRITKTKRSCEILIIKLHHFYFFFFSIWFQRLSRFYFWKTTKGEFSWKIVNTPSLLMWREWRLEKVEPGERTRRSLYQLGNEGQEHNVKSMSCRKGLSRDLWNFGAGTLKKLVENKLLAKLWFFQGSSIENSINGGWATRSLCS